MTSAYKKDAMSTIDRISAPRPLRRALRPRTIFALLLAAAALGGCARYDMTLTNGGRVTNVRKPTRSKDGSYWSYVTASGTTNTVPAGRVISIVRHGDKTGAFISQ